MNNNTPKNHPAYGSITISKVNQGGEGKTLFKSPFKHNNYICLRINSAQITKTFGKNTHFNELNPYIEVAMSETQFSQLLSSHSIGEGIPCTILSVNKEKIEDIPFEYFKKIHEDEFDEKIKEIHQLVLNSEKEINLIMSKKNITSQDKNKVKSLMNKISIELTKNIPFLLELYIEKMQEVTDSAENEIRSNLIAKIQKFGLDKIFENNIENTSESFKLIEN